MADEKDTILELRGITKSYPGIVANDHVDFDLKRGEVHALLGENGAGKSTLMNILYGLTKPDEGQILVGGKPVSFTSAKDAIEAGIGMVHQHFMLIPVMTVAENVVLGTEPVRDGIVLDEATAAKRVADMARTFRFAVDPDARIDSISVGQQQRVEIMKALYRNVDVLVLDEPTAVLTPQEAADLFEILRTLRREGISIIFISHKLNEVLEIADRITVLRRGKKIDTVPREGATEEGLARMMVGREVLLRVDKGPAAPGEVALEVEDLEVLDDRGLEKVRGVSFSVRGGEIVAIAGVDGNGQTELVEAITGLRPLGRGVITVGNRRFGSTVSADYADSNDPGPRAGVYLRDPRQTAIRAVATLGIFTYYWVYRAHKFTRAQSGRGVGAVAGLLIFLIFPVVTLFALPAEIKDVFDRDRQDSPVTWTSGLVGLIPIVGGLIWIAQLQRALNAFAGFSEAGGTQPTPRTMIDAGVGHIPEDRHRRGLVLEFNLAENIALHDYDKPPDSKYGWLFPKRLVQRAARLIKEFDIRGGGPFTLASALSGGNQQKVVVAREVARNPVVLIAAQPTRGLDVGAIEYVHRRLVAERDAGRAILLVSLELDEVLSLADRILVMYEGRIAGEHAGGTSEEEIGLEMLGGRRQAVA